MYLLHPVTCNAIVSRNYYAPNAHTSLGTSWWQRSCGTPRPTRSCCATSATRGPTGGPTCPTPSRRCEQLPALSLVAHAPLAVRRCEPPAARQQPVVYGHPPAGRPSATHPCSFVHRAQAAPLPLPCTLSQRNTPPQSNPAPPCPALPTPRCRRRAAAACPYQPHPSIPPLYPQLNPPQPQPQPLLCL